MRKGDSVKRRKSFREVNPEAAEMWAYDLNPPEITPDNVSSYSDKEVYFRCLENPKHVFKKVIKTMTSKRDGHNVGCLYCGPNAKIPFPGENDLFSVIKEAKKFWDVEKNELNPFQLFPYSAKRAYFTCPEKKHTEYRKIADFSKSPVCQTCRQEKNLLITELPLTEVFWDKERNSMPLDQVIRSLREVFYFKCPACGFEWKERPGNWRKRQHCKCCGFDGTEGSQERNKKLVEEYGIITFRMAYPEEAEWWDYSKNGEDTPDNTVSKSGKKFYFNCKKENHSFMKSGYDFSRREGCPCCNTPNWANRKTLFEAIPQAIEMWDYEKNNGLDPDKLYPNSLEEIWFTCSERQHSFQKKLVHFKQRPYCMECKKIENSIYYKEPLMLKFWDYENNTVSPKEVLANDKEIEINWKCPDCGYKWTQKAMHRKSAKKGKCPCCDMGRVFDENSKNAGNTLLNRRPEVAKFWDYELNKGTPDKISHKSDKQAYLKCCQNSSHSSFKIKVSSIPQNPPYGCPQCEQEYQESILLVNVCPQIRTMWDDALNPEVDINTLKNWQNESVNLRCLNGHVFSRRISSYVKNQNCPYCMMDTVAKNPDLVKQWNFKRNKHIDINLTSSSSKELVWWKCRKCGYEWQAQIVTRKLGKGLCPCCEHRNIVVEGITDLFSLLPETREQYDFEKNKDIDFTKLSVASSESVWWKCNICNHEWRVPPASRTIAEDDQKYRLRECPACAGKARSISYGEQYPNLAERFCEELNGLSLYDITSSKYSRVSYWWHCDVCEENFQSVIGAMIRSRTAKTKGCSYCSGSKVLREKSFAALHPFEMEEYSPENEIDPYTVTEFSGKTAKWICRNNPEHKWSSTFNSRAKQEGLCPICKEYKYKNMLYELYPEFEQYYDAEKNERPFKSYAVKSAMSVWWKCEKEHSFKQQINSFTCAGKFNCPICNNTVLLKGFNDLLSRDKDLALEYDTKKNKVSPDEILISSTDPTTWWICNEEGHEFQKSVHYRVTRSRNCPVCNKKLVIKGVNDYASQYPDVLNIWDTEKNEVYPDQFSNGHNDWYHFKCREGHEYIALLDTEKNNDFVCLICEKKLLQVGVNSLIDTKPELIPEWSDKNERPMSEFFDTSNFRALWKCRICAGEYRENICDREFGDDSCPYCNKKKVLPGVNTLEVIKPELIPEWSDENERPMSDFLDTAYYKAIWNCQTCKGEYITSIREREAGDDACPYCSNRKVLPGVNSFKQRHPDLIKEWNWINNYLLTDPDEILDRYNEPLWWNCPKCGETYLCSPKKRLYYQKRHMESCTYCKGYRRKRRHFI